MKLARRVAWVATVLTFVGCADSQSWSAPEAAPSSEGVFEHRAEIAPYAPGMTRATAYDSVAVDLWAGARSPMDTSVAAPTLRLNLFEDSVVDARLSEARVSGDTRIWEGEVLGHGGSMVTLAQRGDRLVGTVRFDDRVFTIRPRDGLIVIAEWDDRAVPDDAGTTKR